MKNIKNILEQTVPALGFDLVDVEITPSKFIQIFADKDGGITVEDCAFISNHLTRLFTVEEIDFNRLEVSSPGVERPLKKVADFTRFAGKLVKVKTHNLVNETKVHQGILKGIVGDVVSVEISPNVLSQIKLDNIKRARLVFEMKKGI